MRIPLAKPEIGPEEVPGVVRVLESGRLALGPRATEFERGLAEYVGVEFAVAVSGGTGALHLALCALGIGPGDEVITTPFSLVASANCILHVGATPVFADVDPRTLCLDPGRVKWAITLRTKAILAVDLSGHPADWPALERIAAKHDLRLVEDAAEELGSQLGGRRCGSFGEVAILGFYPNEVITTGEGGAVVTDDETVAAVCRSLSTQGRAAEAAWAPHVRLGFNTRMDEMSAAVGVAQLSWIDEFIRRREAVARWYEDALRTVEGVVTPASSIGARVNWLSHVVRLSDGFSRRDRDGILRGLRERGLTAATTSRRFTSSPSTERSSAAMLAAIRSPSRRANGRSCSRSSASSRKRKSGTLLECLESRWIEGELRADVRPMTGH